MSKERDEKCKYTKVLGLKCALFFCFHVFN